MVAAAKVWNMTLRCTTDNNLYHYGNFICESLSPLDLEELVTEYIDDMNLSNNDVIDSGK